MRRGDSRSNLKKGNGFPGVPQACVSAAADMPASARVLKTISMRCPKGGSPRCQSPEDHRSAWSMGDLRAPSPGGSDVRDRSSQTCKKRMSAAPSVFLYWKLERNMLRARHRHSIMNFECLCIWRLVTKVRCLDNDEAPFHECRDLTSNIIDLSRRVWPVETTICRPSGHEPCDGVKEPCKFYLLKKPLIS